ncbi:hypothetical protein SISNIDRAFT_502369 [Sistotremastrum niveocremeum HHB9708]|uniref:Uncharacterized protein n=1 Tax=Sistotremastrum niveocremeum HHB9708 TaxID=1314777 RepID=A0A164WAE8_9AGAM|nr:hypothetical protein SISNIDRAFT_502369 [Sistotremastrum niveocremeum HHB9708]
MYSPKAFNTRTPSSAVPSVSFLDLLDSPSSPAKSFHTASISVTPISPAFDEYPSFKLALANQGYFSSFVISSGQRSPVVPLVPDTPSPPASPAPPVRKEQDQERLISTRPRSKSTFPFPVPSVPTVGQPPVATSRSRSFTLSAPKFIRSITDTMPSWSLGSHKSSGKQSFDSGFSSLSDSSSSSTSLHVVPDQKALKAAAKAAQKEAKKAQKAELKRLRDNRLPPPFMAHVYEYQFLNGGSEKSAIRAILKERGIDMSVEEARRVFGGEGAGINEPVVVDPRDAGRGERGIGGGVYRDEQGGVWMDEEERWEYTALVPPSSKLPSSLDQSQKKHRRRPAPLALADSNTHPSAKQYQSSAEAEFFADSFAPVQRVGETVDNAKSKAGIKGMFRLGRTKA